MGSGTAQRDYLNQVAQAQERQTADVAAAAEDRRALTEGLLGTEAQVAGTLGGVSAEVLPFTTRYKLDPILAQQMTLNLPKRPEKEGFLDSLTSLKGLAGALSGTGVMDAIKRAGSLASGGGGGGSEGVYYGDSEWGRTEFGKMLTGAQAEANSLLEDAQAAAQAGDFDTAQQLKELADKYLYERFGKHPELSKMTGGMGALFAKYEDPTTRAKSQLGSEAARTVGAQVKRGRELTDPNSAEYQRTLAELQNPIKEGVDMAERNIAAGMRGAERYAKQVGASRGAARSFQGEMNAYSNVQRQAALDRSNVLSQGSQALSQAASFMTTQFAPQFANASAALARSWAAGEAGTRDEYIAAVGNLNNAVANFSGQLSQMYQEQAMLSKQLAAQSKADTKALVGGIVGSALGAAGSAAGGMCWAAAEYFGWFTDEWWNARTWIVDGWTTTLGRMFKRFYGKHGRKMAWAIRNVPGVRMALKPLFVWAAKKGGTL